MPLTPGNPTMLGAVGFTGAATTGAFVSLTDSAIVLQKVSAKDGYGSTTSTWEPGNEPVPCRLSRQTRPTEGKQAGVIKAVSEWTCILPLTTDIQPPSRLRVNSPDLTDALFEVTATDRGLSGAVQLTATLRKIN